MRSKELAERLGISPVTLRQWSGEFARHLSPGAQSAQSPTGNPVHRNYSEEDLAVLRRAKALLAAGLTFAEANRRLCEEPAADERVPTAVEPAVRPDGAAFLQAMQQTMAAAIAAKDEALRSKDETIRSKDETIASLRETLAAKDRHLADVQREHARPSEAVAGTAPAPTAGKIGDERRGREQRRAPGFFDRVAAFLRGEPGV
jgi:DNA-binding transcriptional MerR regulator